MVSKDPRDEQDHSNIGDLLQDFVDRVSHVRGDALEQMRNGGVTLPQVLVLRRAAGLGETNITDIAEHVHMSLPAASQMIDRLVALKLIARSEARDDRRRKNLQVTNRGLALLMAIREARSREFAAGVAPLPTPLKEKLGKILGAALKHLRSHQDTRIVR
jgi:DNA-binding MarR family transcriptional regulator